jgi:hypothetical protein
MKIDRKMVHGREQFTAHCPAQGCSVTGVDTSRGRAKSKINTHDRTVHKPKRDAAKRQAKADAKTARSRASLEKAARSDLKRLNSRVRITKTMTDQEIKSAVEKARSNYREAEAAAKDEQQVAPSSRSTSNRTKGIPNVKDGQPISGLVYDKNGKRVPWATIRKYHAVD